MSTQDERIAFLKSYRPTISLKPMSGHIFQAVIRFRFGDKVTRIADYSEISLEDARITVLDSAILEVARLSAGQK